MGGGGGGVGHLKIRGVFFGPRHRVIGRKRKHVRVCLMCGFRGMCERTSPTFWLLVLLLILASSPTVDSKTPA